MYVLYDVYMYKPVHVHVQYMYINWTQAHTHARTRGSTYQHDVGALVVDVDVGFENVEVKGGRDETTIARPLLPARQQQPLAQPWQHELVAAKHARLRLCSKTHSHRQVRVNWVSCLVCLTTPCTAWLMYIQCTCAHTRTCKFIHLWQWKNIKHFWYACNMFVKICSFYIQMTD